MDELSRKALDLLPPGLLAKFPQLAAMRVEEMSRELCALGVDPDQPLTPQREPTSEILGKTQDPPENYSDLEKGILIVLYESGPSLKLEGIAARLEPPAQTPPERAKVEDALLSLRRKQTVDFGGRSPIDWQRVVPTLWEPKGHELARQFKAERANYPPPATPSMVIADDTSMIPEMHNVKKQVLIELAKIRPMPLEDLMRRIGRGRSSVRSAVSNLESNGYVSSTVALPNVGEAGIRIDLTPAGMKWLEDANKSPELSAAGKYIVIRGATSFGNRGALAVEGMVVGLDEMDQRGITAIPYLTAQKVIRPATYGEVIEFDRKFPKSEVEYAAHLREMEALRGSLEERAARAVAPSEKAAFCLELIRELVTYEAKFRVVLHGNFKTEAGTPEEEMMRWHLTRSREMRRLNVPCELLKEAIREVAEPLKAAAEDLDDPQFSSTPLQTLTDQLDQSYPDYQNPAFDPAEALLKRLRPKFLSREQRANSSPIAAIAVSVAAPKPENAKAASVHYHHNYYSRGDQNFAQGDHSTAASKIVQRAAGEKGSWLTRTIAGKLIGLVVFLLGLLVVWYLKQKGWDLKGH